MSTCHHTERSAGLSRSSHGFLFLSLCSACLGCVPLSNTWLGSLLSGRVPPGVSVPALNCRAPGREQVLAQGQVARRALHVPAGECAATFLASYSGLLAEGFLVPEEEGHMWQKDAAGHVAQGPVPTAVFPGTCTSISEMPGEERVSSRCLSHSSCLWRLPNTQVPAPHLPHPQSPPRPPRLLSCRGVCCRTTRSPRRDRASEICFLPCRPRSTQT